MVWDFKNNNQETEAVPHYLNYTLLHICEFFFIF